MVTADKKLKYFNDLCKELATAREALEGEEDKKLQRASWKLREVLLWINKYLDEREPEHAKTNAEAGATETSH